MRRVGKSKVTKLNAKAGAVYPLIRLPRAYGDEIGKVAEIFEIHDRKKRAILVTFSGGLGSSEVTQSDSKVIQPSPEVIQLDGPDRIESRLLELESEIDAIKSLILPNESDCFHKNKKEGEPNGQVFRFDISDNVVLPYKKVFLRGT